VDARNLAAALAGFVVAVLVLLALTLFVGIDEVVATLQRADLRLVGVVALSILLWNVLWGFSLQVVVSAVGDEISTWNAVLVHAGAAFANHVTPFGQAGGEPITAWLLSDVSGAPFERSMAAVTSFDVINLIPSLTLATLGLAYYSVVTALGSTLQQLAVGVLVLVFVLPAVGLTLWRRRETTHTVLVRVLTPVARGVGRLLPGVSAPKRADVAERIDRFADGVGSVATDRRRVTAAVGFSAGGWLLQAVGLWVALQAVGATVPPYVPLFVVPLGALAGALPTPGGLGGIEAIQVGLLTATTAVVDAKITAAVLVFSVGGFLLTTSIGAAAATVIKLRRDEPTAV